MHQVPPSHPILKCRGLLFHVQTLRASVPGAPTGLAIDLEFLQSSPTLYRVDSDGTEFVFKVVDPLLGVPDHAPIRSIKKLIYQADPKTHRKVDFAPVELYAVVRTDRNRIEHAFEHAIAEAEDSDEVRAVGQQLLSRGFELSQYFIDVVRGRYGQYWSEIPHDASSWSYVLYYSRVRRAFYSLVLSSEERPPALQSSFDRPNDHWGHVVVGSISSKLPIGRARGVRPRSFADEMIATSLTELSTDRVRSSVLHAIIALEACAKSALSALVDGTLPAGSSPSVIDAISREVSLSLLARHVFENSPARGRTLEPNWDQIEELYQLRNRIVHRGQRKLPSVATVIRQVLEVKTYVDAVESEIAKAR